MEHQAFATAPPPVTGARVALLVDGDNIAADWAGRLLLRAARLGSVIVKRAYCDVSHARNWEGSGGFGLHVARTGANAADMLLTIDAVDLAHRGDLSVFVIASNDGGFAPLARYLVERGATVLGLGEAVSPPDWRKSCSLFEVLERPKPAPSPATGAAAPTEEARSEAEAVRPPSGVPAGGPSELSATDAKLRELILSEGEKGSLALLHLGPRMNVLYRLTLTAIGAKGWRSYLAGRPALYRLDPKGPEARVHWIGPGPKP